MINRFSRVTCSETCVTPKPHERDRRYNERETDRSPVSSRALPVMTLSRKHLDRKPTLQTTNFFFCLIILLF